MFRKLLLSSSLALVCLTSSSAYAGSFWNLICLTNPGAFNCAMALTGKEASRAKKAEEFAHAKRAAKVLAVLTPINAIFSLFSESTQVDKETKTDIDTVEVDTSTTANTEESVSKQIPGHSAYGLLGDDEPENFSDFGSNIQEC